MARRAKSNTSALDVANYLIQTAARESRYLDPMRLQKLLYYAQCWHLAETQAPLFDEQVEAWTWGPVVRIVWKAYSGKQPIMPRDVYFDKLTAEQQDIVDAVWLSYREFNALQLSRMSHKERPWIAARKGRQDADRSDAPLSLDLMRKSAQAKLAEKNAWLRQNWARITKRIPGAA